MSVKGRPMDDIVSDMLNAPGASIDRTKHVHVFRKEYPICLIRGCGVAKDRRASAAEDYGETENSPPL